MEFLDPFSEKKQTTLPPCQFGIEMLQLGLRPLARCFRPKMANHFVPMGTERMEKRILEHALMLS